MSALITTTDSQRLRLWQRLVGRDTLPVKAARPRQQYPPNSDRPVLAYDLDAGRLHPMARARFASHVARRYRMPYAQALSMVDGWPITAAGCVVTREREGETAVPSGAAVLLWGMA